MSRVTTCAITVAVVCYAPIAAPASIVADATDQADVSIRLVALDSPGSADELAELPPSQAEFTMGNAFFVEMWARTTDPNGLSQVSADISFDPSIISATEITHTTLFDLFPFGSIDNLIGLIDDLSGSHFPGQPSCGDQVGVSAWARVAVVEMMAEYPGISTIHSTDSGTTAYTVVLCGSLEEPTVEYDTIEIMVTTDIPTISEWGAVVMVLLLISAGTFILMQRHPVRLV